ncbi:MAG: iron-siderophore ABC transporter substrate-binding protein [Cyanobacteria bacterium P01_H01_bin.21]
MINLQSKTKPVGRFLGALVTATVVSSCSGSALPNYEPIPPSEGRVIQHELGETVVPKTPQRIVLLGSVVDALALGIKPTGAAVSGIPQRANSDELVAMLSERTKDITVVGHSQRPELERIVRLQPDLILISKGGERLYPRLSQIAPTVFIDTSRGADAWQDYVLESASAMGKRDEAKAMIDLYEQRIDQFKQAMGSRLETTVVSVARFRPEQARIYQQNSFSGAVLADAGLLRPESQQRNKPYEAISLESLSTMDGDVLFFMQDNPEKSVLSQVQQHPLWSQLEVVQQEAVYEVSLEVWFLNAGIVTAHMILNDLFRTLVPDGEQYVIDQVGELILP